MMLAGEGAPRPVLFGYGGSDDAKAAIERAGATLRPGPAVVATAWTTFRDMAAAALVALPRGMVAEAVRGIDAETRGRAEQTAAEGAERARAAGFAAEPRAVGGSLPYFRSLLDVAEEIDAAIVVLGSRGRSSMSAALLGSVSSGVLHHGSRPVLVVPRRRR
jgi:nucleotide-binding universal stress UspA family protein